MCSPSTPICAHTAAMDESNNIIYVFGGWDGKGTIFDSILGFNVNSNKWIDIGMKQKPLRRFGHGCSTFLNGSFLTFGGTNEVKDFGDVCSFRKK